MTRAEAARRYPEIINAVTAYERGQSWASVRPAITGPSLGFAMTASARRPNPPPGPAKSKVRHLDEITARIASAKLRLAALETDRRRPGRIEAKFQHMQTALERVAAKRADERDDLFYRRALKELAQ